MDLKLHVIDPDGREFAHPASSDVIVIGRSSKADVRVPDRSISRTHARLSRSNGAWQVEDLGSRNGTLVNGFEIEGPTGVHIGDVINVGGCTIRLDDATATSGLAPVSRTESGTLFRPARDLLEKTKSEPQQPVPPSDAMRRYTDRLKTLNEVHQALDRTVGLSELLELILDRIFHHLGPEQGAIFLKGDDGYECAASRSVAGADASELHSRHLLEEVVEGGKAALVFDTEDDARFNQADSLLSAGVRSLVAAPLLDPRGALGMIVLASRLHVRQFSEADMELLTSLASVAAMRIRNVRLAEEAAEREQLSREVGLARQIQVALLPDRLPEVPGWSLHAGNLPSRWVSGDFYKVHVREETGELVLLVADVSGKGVAAALLTASLEALAAAPIAAGLPPHEVCRTASDLLYERTPPEKFATAFLAYVDPAVGEVRFCNSGHNPGLLVRATGEVEWLRSTGMPLGILPVGSFIAGEAHLDPGDLLLLYTDGITEAENPAGEEFGNERLRDAVLRNRHRPLPEATRAVERELSEFAAGVPFLDDRTVVVVRRGA